jgi:hypothetical protein
VPGTARSALARPCRAELASSAVLEALQASITKSHSARSHPMTAGSRCWVEASIRKSLQRTATAWLAMRNTVTVHVYAAHHYGPSAAVYPHSGVIGNFRTLVARQVEHHRGGRALQPSPQPTSRHAEGRHRSRAIGLPVGAAVCPQRVTQEIDLGISRTAASTCVASARRLLGKLLLPLSAWNHAEPQAGARVRVVRRPRP